MTLSSSDSPTAEDISGVWRGRYTSTRVPEPTQVVLMFQQLTARELEASPLHTGPRPDPVAGESVVGVYKGETGAIGTMVGSIVGGDATLNATQTTPTCPGDFELHGTVVRNEFTWEFRGQDCLGDEVGQGRATRS